MTLIELHAFLSKHIVEATDLDFSLRKIGGGKSPTMSYAANSVLPRALSECGKKGHRLRIPQSVPMSSVSFGPSRARRCKRISDGYNGVLGMTLHITDLVILNFLMLIGLGAIQVFLYKLLINRLPEVIPPNIYFNIFNNSDKTKEADIERVELSSSDRAVELTPSFVGRKKIIPPNGTISWYIAGDDIKDQGFKLSELKGIRLLDSYGNYTVLSLAEVKRIRNIR